MKMIKTKSGSSGSIFALALRTPRVSKIKTTTRIILVTNPFFKYKPKTANRANFEPDEPVLKNDLKLFLL